MTIHEEMISKGFSATRLLQDEGFERGFFVNQFEQKGNFTHGLFQDYCDVRYKAPLWRISPWWSKYDLIDDRDLTRDKYTLADKYGVNSITYNPEIKSLTLRQNATKFYEGKPHIKGEVKWWPHLLVAQDATFCPFDKERNSANAERMVAEIDVRLLDFKHTTNPEGINNPSFLIYFFLHTDKAPGQKIWFGLRIFNSLKASTDTTPGWRPDSALHQFMYGITSAEIFGGIENSFNPQKDVVNVSDEWKNIRFDVTHHLDTAVEWANRDNIFGSIVKKSDFYFSGANIGFETHGNFDYTVEFKNFNMVSYNK